MGRRNANSPTNAKPFSLAAMLFDCYGADGILLNDSTKTSTANASLQHICKAKTEDSLAKELQNLRFCQQLYFN
jgi:hypothetical protein